MKLRYLILLLAFAAATPGSADDESAKPPGPGEGAKGQRGPNGKEKGRPPMREGGRPEWGGKGPPGGRSPMSMGGQEFQKLPEEERKRVRDALEKAWGHEDVEAAREKMMRANENMRATIRRVLMEIDPHVAEVLEKIRPPGDRRGPGFGQPLDPKSPEFGRQVAQRLGRELQAFSRPDKHEETREFHEKVLTLPIVKEAFAKMQKLPPAEREEAVAKVREVYRQAVAGEMKRIREKAEAAKTEAGSKDKPKAEDNPPAAE